MKNYIYILLIFLLIGCGNSDDITINSPYKHNGINIEYNASKNLNMFNNQSFSILLLVYQLNDKNMFNQLCSNEDSKQLLLKGTIFDKSVLGVSNTIIFPNQTSKIVLDKLENVKFIGLVAGFYNSPKCLLIPIPKKKSILKFWKSSEIQALNIKIKLLNDNIEIIKKD